MTGAHFGSRHLACRRAGASGGRATGSARRRGRHAELSLFETADLVAQPCRLLEFEIGGGGTHALLEIGDHRLEVGTLIVYRLALAETDRHVVVLVDAIENVGDAAPDALRRDAVRGVVGLLLLAPAIGLADRRLEAVGHSVGVDHVAALDTPQPA